MIQGDDEEGGDLPEIPEGQGLPGQGQQEAPPGTILISQADEQAINRVIHP